MQKSRIPALHSTSRKGVSGWFEAMGAARLLFHPDNDPASIVHADSGSRFFSASEVRKLRGIVRRLFRAQGERVYDLGLPAFHRAQGITIER